jgi:hypothetical protein
MTKDQDRANRGQSDTNAQIITTGGGRMDKPCPLPISCGNIFFNHP